MVAEPLPGVAAAADGELRLSIAGAQEKTALLWHQNQWCRPQGSTPTTHLFKLPMGLVGSGQIDFSSSVENEWLCGRILAAYGLPVAASSLASFAGQRCLIVERFDRAGVPSSGVIPPAPPPRRSRGGPRTSGDWLRLALQGVGRPVSLV